MAAFSSLWRIRRACAVVLLVGTVACSGDGASTPLTSELPSTSTPSAPTTGATTSSDEPTTVPVATTSTTSTTAATTTSAPATTTSTTVPGGLPTDPDLLAGTRVLCSFFGTAVPDDVVDRVERGLAAGILVYQANLARRDEAVEIAAAVQAAAANSPSGLPAIVAVDQEGGQVLRIPGPPSMNAERMGQRPPEEIRAEGEATAALLLDWGINLDLAPVADIARPGTLLDIQNRTYSTDPAVAATAVEAFVVGLRDGGVASTLKHFPGLGATDANPDKFVATVDVDLDTFWAVDAPPFAAGIAAGAELVMMSSAVHPAFDSVPAVLSTPIVDDLLRDTFGFDAVVMSDAVGTPSLAPYGSVEETVLAASTAGVDLFITGDPALCVDVQGVLADGVRSGTIPLVDAQASYTRLAQLRAGLR